MAMTAANLRAARARLEDTIGAEHAASWPDDQVAMWAANSTDLAQELERRSWSDHIAHAERLGAQHSALVLRGAHDAAQAWISMHRCLLDP